VLAEETAVLAEDKTRKDRGLGALIFWILRWGLVAALLGFGLILGAGGAVLVAKGGSPYYLAAGLVQFAAGVQLLRGRQSAIHIYVFYFAATWIWALWEVGLDGWALLPRINMACLLMPFLLLPVVWNNLKPDGLSERLKSLRPLYFPAGMTWVALIAAMISANAWSAAYRAIPPWAARPDAAVQPATSEWRYIGQNAMGHRFAPISLINRDNAKNMRLEWDFKAPPYSEPPPAVDDGGPAIHAAGRRDEATPLYVNGKLYICDPESVVTALDAETGALAWRHDPHIDTTGVPSRLCRGLAYFEDPHAQSCPKRIIVATLDLRLQAIDAETGARCDGFGTNGEVSLRTGYGDFKIGQVYPTSPPTIVNGVAVLGALVTDNYSTGEPSGVIRGFDAHTGKLVWAWDMGRPGQMGEPGPGERYTPGTPNAWGFFSGDEALGLVYVQTGNATPDYVSSHRDALWEKYSSAVVALDSRTGHVRWSFQTTHRDVWDYDVASQPILYDMPTAEGVVPALIQTTKGGQIYLLDRRTGEPLSKVEEKPVPQTDVPGESSAPTQPFSVDMPNVAGPQLRETDMWGISPFDQLFCRLQFHTVRYEGPYTPPSLRGGIASPGQTGGTNWGSATLDPGRNVLIVPSTRVASNNILYKRMPDMPPIRHTEQQFGTPYLVDGNAWFTPLYVPCQAPPYALLSAIDLKTRQLLWEKPLGTAEELGPRGFALHLPFVIGAPPLVGGAIATSGDLIFVAAVSDRKLRAIDLQTGRVLWSQRLPEGGQATPITYRAPRSGRQMVVIVSGSRVDLLGVHSLPMHVVAYALPN
jgi:membrane-bound PQQ-dependent dehydrogenase (glucose/quinate/shikimate family)